jgi:hypothetical protein
MRVLCVLLVPAVLLSAVPSAEPKPKPRFVDVTAGSGLKIGDNTGVGGTNAHGVAIADFNGDGLSDIIIVTFGKPHVRYFKNLGNLRFADVTKGSGLESFQGEGTGAAAADFDNDGDLDLLLVNFYSNLVLYRNDTNNRSWLRVKPVGSKSNRDGIGAKVWVYAEGGAKKLVGFREVQSGSGYGRSSPLEAHFGLGKTPAASYRVEVYFPAAKKRIVKENVKPGQRIIVKEAGG